MRTLAHDNAAQSIHVAKTRLSELVARARNGEKIYIGRFGRAEVVMSAVEPSEQPGDVSAALARMDVYARAHPARPKLSIDEIVAWQRQERDWPEPAGLGKKERA